MNENTQWICEYIDPKGVHKEHIIMNQKDRFSAVLKASTILPEGSKVLACYPDTESEWNKLDNTEGQGCLKMFAIAIVFSLIFWIAVIILIFS